VLKHTRTAHGDHDWKIRGISQLLKGVFLFRHPVLCSYRHVSLPERITVGDDLVLEYGSNTKQHAFRVGQIIRTDGGGCAILRDGSQQSEDGDMIEVYN
jgi:hypothetical protein